MIRLGTNNVGLIVFFTCFFLIHATDCAMPHPDQTQPTYPSPAEATKTYIINVTITQTARGTSNTAAGQPANLDLAQKNPSQTNDLTASQTPPPQESSWLGTCAKVAIGTAVVGAIAYGGVAYLGIAYLYRDKIKKMLASGERK